LKKPFEIFKNFQFFSLNLDSTINCIGTYDKNNSGGLSQLYGCDALGVITTDVYNGLKILTISFFFLSLILLSTL